MSNNIANNVQARLAQLQKQQENDSKLAECSKLCPHTVSQYFLTRGTLNRTIERQILASPFWKFAERSHDGVRLMDDVHSDFFDRNSTCDRLQELVQRIEKATELGIN